MTRNMLSVAVVLIGLAFAAGPALGQPGEDKEAQAREHYQQAVSHERRSEWDQAIAEYRKAQALFPDPEFNVLIGDAYVKKGDEASALRHYRDYLAEAPGGRAAERVGIAVEDIEQRLAAEAKDSTELEPVGSPERDAALETTEPDTGAETVDPAITRSAPARPGRGLRIAGLSSAAAGLGLVGVGVVFALKARSINSELENLGPGDTWDPGRYDDGKAANRNAFIFTGIGAAAVATGGVLYMLGSRRPAAEEDPAFTIAPSAGPDGAGAGVLVRGRF